MSQHSLDPPSRSQSNTSSLHYHRCWWAWCRHNCYTRKELLDHVISEHVQKARPVRLTDIHALQTAENNYWDSLDFGSLPALPHTQGENYSQAGSHRQVNPMDIPSSLPSPPASSPQDPGTPVHKQPHTDLSMKDEALQVPCAPVSSQLSNGLFTPSSKQNVFDTHLLTPSFASLSSQPNTPNKMSYNVPDSPCFDLLVAEATRRPIQSIPAPTGSQDSNDVASSPPEETSQEFVFNQLTQGIDNEERSQEPSPRSRNGGSTMNTDFDDVPDSRQAILQSESQSSQSDTQQPNLPPPAPLQIQTHFLSITVPDSPSRFRSPVYPSTTPVARQSWYQPQRRRLPKKKSASETSVGHSSPATSPLAKAVTPMTSPIPTNFLPAAVRGAQSPTSVTSQVSHSALQSQAQCQADSWTQTNSTQLSSYPLLTQAPLRSQSLSQD